MTTTVENSLLVEQSGPVLWLTLNRPQQLNSVTPAMLDRIDAALCEAESRQDVHLVALTGNGRAFSAGADLKAIREYGRDEDEAAAMSAFFERAGRVFSHLESCPKPTIAALNGITLAAGIEITLCCDLVFAAPAARIGDGHANYGMLPAGGGSVRLARRIGPSRAKHMLFSGELYSPDLLEHWGLVDEVVEEGALRERVQRFGEILAAKSPLCIGRMKELVAVAGQQTHAAALLHERRIAELHVHAHDRNEGLAAFAEKRKPCFTGR